MADTQSPTEHPIVCGIINATPDSFYDGGKYPSIIEHAVQMIDDGADWLDVGGESTRPGATPVGEQEEIDRVLPVIEAVVRHAPKIPISIDTTKALVAKYARQAGASILNDVRGFQDMAMQEVSALYPISILMHSRGTPQTMQLQTQYDNVVEDIQQWLTEQVLCCKSPEIWLDPGIGFAKTTQQNLVILKHLQRLTSMPYPVLLGTSRKSFIGQQLQRSNPTDRLFGSLATVADGYQKGIRAFRVHDVKATKDVLDMLVAIQHAE